MAKELSYSQQHAQEITLSTREILRELPDVCADFLRAIEPTTQPLTRFAYAYDLKLFFHYLQTEVPRFAGKTRGLYARYEREGEAFVPSYCRLLSLCGSGTVAQIAAGAGIDVCSPGFWQSALAGVLEDVRAFEELAT